MPNNILETVVILLVAFLSFDCTSKKTVYPPRSTKGEDGRIAYVSRTFKFGDEELRADYGRLIAAENRQNTASRFIHLTVIRIHARNKNSNPPIFCLTGGLRNRNKIWPSLPINQDRSNISIFQTNL
jgi:hypothetical protein